MAHAVTPDPTTVIPDLIRDPVLRRHWIAVAETPDLIRGRNDNAASVPICQCHEFRKYR
jgi:hypothetical protein